MKKPTTFIQPDIFYRNSFVGGDGWVFYPLRVTISATCPTCDELRGPLTGGRVIEDGEVSFVNQWVNPCGHQDSYKDAYLEYRQLVAQGILDDNGLPVEGQVLETPREAKHPNAA